MSYNEEALTDAKITKMLETTLNEPTVSGELVDRLSARFSAVEKGREAEKRLADRENPPAREEVPELAAQSLVGHIMMNRTPPRGVTQKMMVSQLTGMEAFRRLTSGPLDRLVHDLRSGELIRSIVKEAAPRTPQTKAPEAAAPEVKNPEIHAPRKNPGAPSL